MRAAPRCRLSEEIEDNLPDGGHARLWRWGRRAKPPRPACAAHDCRACGACDHRRCGRGERQKTGQPIFCATPPADPLPLSSGQQRFGSDRRLIRDMVFARLSYLGDGDDQLNVSRIDILAVRQPHCPQQTALAQGLTNGQVERMNRTIKEATVRRYHYDSHDQLRRHLGDIVDAYNCGRRLKTLHGLTPYNSSAKHGHQNRNGSPSIRTTKCRD